MPAGTIIRDLEGRFAGELVEVSGCVAIRRPGSVSDGFQITPTTHPPSFPPPPPKKHHTKSQAGEELVVARGGRGGRGNLAFKSPRNTAPKMAEKGEEGVEHWLTVELR